MTNIFTHGILYQVLLRSESHSTWAVFYTRMHYMHGASSLGGRMSWLSMIIMGLCVIPLVRRYYYKVCTMQSFSVRYLHIEQFQTF